MGVVLDYIVKHSENRITFYDTPKRVIGESEQDLTAEYEDHSGSGSVSKEHKFAETRPVTNKDYPYHGISDEMITKRINNSPIKYFLDGSRHVYKTGDILIDGVVYPVVVGQIIIGCCMRDERRMMHFEVNRQIVMSVPDRFCCDRHQTKNFYLKKCEDINNELIDKRGSRGGFCVQFDAIIPYDTSGDEELGKNKYMSRAISRVQNHMTDCERAKVAELCMNHVLNEDNSWLIKDGSLEYRKDMTNRTDDSLMKAMYDTNMKNVIGVSKGFNAELLLEVEPKIGKIIAELPEKSRTNAYLYTHEGNKYCVWYLRIRETPNKENKLSDVIKVEMIILGNEVPSSSKIDIISAHLINEAYPVCFGKDSRWANHLYPVYVTETYAKSKYIDDNIIINQI